jgi:multidrug efflux system membrane fusion protein
VLNNVVTVPVSAVNHGPNGTFVYVVKPNDKADEVDVSVGDVWNDRQVVSRGLSGNETVVVGGQSRLVPGALVKATAESGGGAPAT